MKNSENSGKFEGSQNSTEQTEGFKVTERMEMVLAADELLTIEEVAARLKCTVAEIYSLTRQRRTYRGLLQLPHRKVGRRLMFVWHDVVDWMNLQKGYELPEGGQQ